MALFLGLDAGTQGAKALIYDAEAQRVVGRGAASYGLLPARATGEAEQEPWTWVEGVESALAQALAAPGVEARALRGLAIGAQQHGFVALDERQQPIRPAKLWCDTSTAPEAAELAAALGRPLPAGYTASKVLWLKRHEPANFARLRTALLPHDYLNFHFSGRLVAEGGDASGTGYYDAERGAWDARAAAAIDPSFPRCLPPLIGPDEAVGRIRPELAARLGLPEDLLIAPGSGDNMMSALGAGAVREGVLVMSLGTSGTLFAHAPRPLIDPAGLIAPFRDATGGGLPLLCTMNCTTVAEEVRAAFALDHDELTALAANEAPGAGGLSFLPYLAGERAPDLPHACGVLHGLRAGRLRPGPLFRAALEGATFALLRGHERLRRFGVAADEIRLVGGGSRNPLWRRIVADLFQLPLRFPVEAESAALGAALQAAAVWSKQPVRRFVQTHPPPLASGVVAPDSKAHAAYREAYRAWRELGATLFEQGAR